MFTFTVNETTGLKEANFTAQLVSIANKPLTNKNGKEYYPCSIKFVNKDAVEVTKPAMMNAGNYSYGVEVGNSYLSKVAIQKDGTPLITVSHLTGAARATADDFM
jgi:hypothetical protein